MADVRTRSRLSTSVAGIAHAVGNAIPTERGPLKGLGRHLEDMKGGERVELRRAVGWMEGRKQRGDQTKKGTSD